MQKDTSFILPLFFFFQQLRQNDYPLGTGDYQKFIFTLEKLYGLRITNYTTLLKELHQNDLLDSDTGFIPKAHLLRICKLLWLKPNQSVDLFEELFTYAYRMDMEILGLTEGKPPDRELPHYFPPDKPEKIVNDLEPEASPEVYHPDTTELEDQMTTDKIAVRVGIGKNRYDHSIELKEPDHETEAKSKFLYTQNYFPLDTRKVYQNLRLLPTLRQSDVYHQIDIQATIDKTIQKGVFLGAVWRKNKVNTTNLLVLIDNGPSMIAFDQLSDNIKTALEQIFTVRKGKKEKELQVFYLFDADTNFFYKNKNHTQSEPVQYVLDQLKNKFATALVISDAGSAEGSKDPIRTAASLELLLKLKTHVGRVAWLNPMPKSRWRRTPATKISTMTAMFEATESGIKNAVDYLKGISIITQQI